jgi:hypothetical protein
MEVLGRTAWACRIATREVADQAMDLMLTGRQVQRNLAATGIDLGWLVHSRTRRSHGSRAQRPSGRFEQLDREQSLVSRPPVDGRPAPAQPGAKTRTAARPETEDPKVLTRSTSGGHRFGVCYSATLRCYVLKSSLSSAARGTKVFKPAARTTNCCIQCQVACAA